MKNLIILITMIAAFSANARSLYPEIYTAKILTERTQKDHQVFLQGNLEVNKMRNTIKMTLLHGPHCPPFAFCIEVLYTQEINLPIVNTSTDECGAKTYTALKDERPVDGIFEYVRVTDYTDYVCPTFNILPETAINTEKRFYDRINGREVINRNYYTAEALELF
tara:strand:- start:27260 stop:27754 length:495 start_codon:yes stop_codon:yes gene_type:complete